MLGLFIEVIILLEIAEVIKKELNIDVEEISCKIRIVFLT
jgi:hypothetical protein